MSKVIEFPSKKRVRGYVYIYPCMVDGGSWGVEFESLNGSVEFVGSYLAFDTAENIAKGYAAKHGAEFKGMYE